MPSRVYYNIYAQLAWRLSHIETIYAMYTFEHGEAAAAEWSQLCTVARGWECRSRESQKYVRNESGTMFMTAEYRLNIILTTI